MRLLPQYKKKKNQPSKHHHPPCHVESSSLSYSTDSSSRSSFCDPVDKHAASAESLVSSNSQPSKYSNSDAVNKIVSALDKMEFTTTTTAVSNTSGNKNSHHPLSINDESEESIPFAALNSKNDDSVALASATGDNFANVRDSVNNGVAVPSFNEPAATYADKIMDKINKSCLIEGDEATTSTSRYYHFTPLGEDEPFLEPSYAISSCSNAEYTNFSEQDVFESTFPKYTDNSIHTSSAARFYQPNLEPDSTFNNNSKIHHQEVPLQQGQKNPYDHVGFSSKSLASSSASEKEKEEVTSALLQQETTRDATIGEQKCAKKKGNRVTWKNDVVEGDNVDANNGLDQFFTQHISVPNQTPTISTISVLTDDISYHNVTPPPPDYNNQFGIELNNWIDQNYKNPRNHQEPTQLELTNSSSCFLPLDDLCGGLSPYHRPSCPDPTNSSMIINDALEMNNKCSPSERTKSKLATNDGCFSRVKHQQESAVVEKIKSNTKTTTNLTKCFPEEEDRNNLEMAKKMYQQINNDNNKFAKRANEKARSIEVMTNDFLKEDRDALEMAKRSAWG